MVYKLHACVRRAFVWAFTRLPYLEEEEAVDTSTFTLPNGMTRQEAAFHIIKQDIPAHYVGSCLMYVLLGPSAQEGKTSGQDSISHMDEVNVRRAIRVLKDLVYHKYREPRLEGVALLSVCTNDPDARRDLSALHVWSAHDILPTILLGGELLHADQDTVQYLVEACEDFQPGRLRPFTDAELARYWEEITPIWQRALFNDLMLDGRGMVRGFQLLIFSLPFLPFCAYQRQLTRAWYGLLRAQMRVMTSQTVLASRVENILVSILDWKSNSELKTTSTDNVRCTQLNAITKLWLEAKKILSLEVLHRVAVATFSALLQKEVSNEDEQAWRALIDTCTELFIFGGAECLKIHREDELFRSKVLVWKGLAGSWLSAEPLRPWESTVALLSVPLWYVSR